MNTQNNSKKNVLIIDDEPDICQLAEITLTRMGLHTQSAHDLKTAKRLLNSHSFDLCLTDMNLPDGNGIDLVEYIQQNFTQTPVAVITAYGNMESAVRALKAGAFDFVAKPVDLTVLRNLVNSAITLPDVSTPPLAQSNETQLLGNSKVMQVLKAKIAKLSRSQAPVFIHGESGCGKELSAQLIHQQGSRSNKPFIAVNCGAIPAELMESEFFGHKKGSFTGATIDKDGLFMAASGGTLFLDEVADLPLQMQVKLLRAIQEKAIRPVGDHNELPVDVRILSASHKDLTKLVAEGKFREDLYYRINVIELEVPSLKQRPEDIPNLVAHFIIRLANKSQITPLPNISHDAMTALEQYSYPGNVRELENILERAIALIDSNTITIDDLNLSIHPTSETLTPDKNNEARTSPENVSSLLLAEQEKEVITHALEKTRWNKTAAANLLGITLRQLRYRLKKFGIE